MGLLVLIDEILASKIFSEADKALLKSAVVIRADNISDYLYLNNQQEVWDLTQDFPCVAPPFERIWVEYDIPAQSNSEGAIVTNQFRPRVGVFIESEGIEHLDYRWLCKATIYQKLVGGLLGCLIIVTWYVTPEGEFHLVDPDGFFRMNLKPLADHPSFQDQKFIDDAKKHSISHLFVPLLSLSFFHCKNVEFKKAPPPNQKLQKARGRKGKLPLIRWHTLTIEPVKRIIAAANNGNSDLTPKALHICRGHFKDFSERGLFGKYKGLYWWDSQVRGTSKSGVVLKDYQVRSGDGL